MCDNLRKIIFTLGSCEFDPDATEAERKEMEEHCKDRRGYFHRWIEDVDCSKEIPCIKPLALVEEVESGEIFEVQPHHVKFVIDWL